MVCKKGYESIGLFLIKMMRFAIIALGYIGIVAMLLAAGTIFVHNILFIKRLFLKPNIINHHYPSMPW